MQYLCRQLFASESSIRRDLKKLEDGGFVKRSYGGATLSGFSNIVTFSTRTTQNIAQKREIVQKAVTQIRDADVVFLDQSSTAFYLATELVNRTSLTVVTNNIEILILLSHSGVKVISTGGTLSDENRNCLVGGEAMRTFDGIFADVVFFSVKALSLDGVLSDCDCKEVELRNVMLKNANQKVLLCDSSKFGKTAHFKQCDLSDTDCLISDGTSANAFKNLNLNIDLL